MICKECGSDKSENEMFHYKVRGVSKPSSMCKDCHSIASSKGGLGKQPKIKTGYLVAINSVSYDHENKLNEFVFLSFCQKPLAVIKMVKSMALRPVIVYGQWKLDNQQFNQIKSEIKNDLHHDKWYFFSQKVKNVLMGLAP